MLVAIERNHGCTEGVVTDGLPSRSSFTDMIGPPPRRFATLRRGILRLHS